MFIPDAFCYTNKTDEQIKAIEYLHYNKSKSSFKQSKQNQLLNFFSCKNMVICRDFNSKHNLWGSTLTALNGKISELIQDILNDGSGTH